MMSKPLLTMCAAVTVSAAAISIAHAQQVYYPPPGGGYTTSAPQPYSPGGYPADYRRAPNFDALDDEDDAGPARLPPPGPVMSPDDPRYGRPPGPPPVYTGPVLSPEDPRYGRPAGGPPVYSGPVMSPDDPRYGRPAPIYTERPPGPPPVIYGDRPPGPQQPYYNDRANADPNAPRPPEGVAGASGATGSVSTGPDGRPMTVASLPPEEQPEAAPVQLAPNLRRQEVPFATKEPAGTIVVDTPNTYLYYVLGGGRAIRYGVRVGRQGFTWTGVQKIRKKTEWPDWYPPTEMIERQPYLPRFMAGGPGNPLGARAMYLGSTEYRIHGTNQPSTIGKFVSSGCIGMLNEDVSDLFERVKVGTRVVVLPGSPPPGTATASAAPSPGQAAAPQPPMAAGGGGTQPTVVPPLPAPVTVR
jgi:lipoprotein-anchoring transpeptidase ErfK/SrfK